jgi:hypothetical protein
MGQVVRGGGGGEGGEGLGAAHKEDRAEACAGRRWWWRCLLVFLHSTSVANCGMAYLYVRHGILQVYVRHRILVCEASNTCM